MECGVIYNIRSTWQMLNIGPCGQQDDYIPILFGVWSFCLSILLFPCWAIEFGGIMLEFYHNCSCSSGCYIIVAVCVPVCGWLVGCVCVCIWPFSIGNNVKNPINKSSDRWIPTVNVTMPWYHHGCIYFYSLPCIYNGYHSCVFAAWYVGKVAAHKAQCPKPEQSISPLQNSYSIPFKHAMQNEQFICHLANWAAEPLSEPCFHFECPLHK